MSKFIFTLPVDTPLELVGGGNTLNIQVISSNLRHPLVVLKSGVKGDKGEPGGSIILTAPIDLGGNRVVMANGNYADNSDSNTLNKVIGFTKTSALQGQLVEVMLLSELNGFSSLIPNEPLYLLTAGTITQTPPAIGYVQQVGVALSSTKILINISKPINR